MSSVAQPADSSSSVAPLHSQTSGSRCSDGPSRSQHEGAADREANEHVRQLLLSSPGGRITADALAQLLRPTNEVRKRIPSVAVKRDLADMRAL